MDTGVTICARAIPPGLVVALALSLVAAVNLILFLFLRVAVDDDDLWPAPYTWFLISLAFAPVYASVKATKIRYLCHDNRRNAWKGITSMAPFVANFGSWSSMVAIHGALPLIVNGPLVLALAIIAGFGVFILFDRYAHDSSTGALRRDTPT